MRKYSFFFILLVCTIILTACSNGSNIDYKNLHTSFYNLDDETEDIYLSLLNEEITPEDAILTLIYDNLSNDEYIYNDNIQIEIFLDNDWHILPVDEEFLRRNTTSDNYILLPNDLYYHEISLKNIIGELQTGNYRIIKSFLKDNHEYFKSIEFYIS